jgi:molybdopterin-binding protein
MSYIKAEVTNIKKADTLYLIELKFKDNRLYAISLDLIDNIEVGKDVLVSIKPSSLTISKEFIGAISFDNMFISTIKEIKEGEILSSIKLDFLQTRLESIITTKSSQSMNLKSGDSVISMINPIELSIVEVF